ncbi:MAG: hypothetical protein QGG42_08225 [Phycisphaerae bacterium]|jgi:hypothetical protein|nr:hypothetical protein [Phycisphaerae bacterium]
MNTKVYMFVVIALVGFSCLMTPAGAYGQVTVKYSDEAQNVINDSLSQAEIQKLINDGLKEMGKKNPAAKDLYDSKQTIKILCVEEPAAKKLGFKPTPPIAGVLVGGFAETKGDFLNNGKPKPGGTVYIAVDCGRLKLFGWWRVFDHPGGRQKMWNVLVHELLHATNSARKHPPDKLTVYETWIQAFNRSIRKARMQAASRYFQLQRDRKKTKTTTRPKNKEVSMRLPRWPGGGLVCSFVPSGRNYGDIGDLSITNTTDLAIVVTVREGLLLDSTDPGVQDLYIAVVPTIVTLSGAKELNRPITVRAHATYTIKHIPGFCPDFELAPPARGAADIYTIRPPDEKSRALIATVRAAREFDVGSMKLKVFGPDKAREMLCQSAVWVVDSQTDQVKGNEVTGEVLVTRYWKTFELSAREKLEKLPQADRKAAETTVKIDIRKIVAATAFLAKNRPDGGGNKYDKNGYDKDGYDRSGYNIYGYDKRGYNRSGFDKDGYDRDGYNGYGYDKGGYNRWGRDRFGRTRGRGMGGTKYDKDGYDRYGYDRNGFNRKGTHKNGTKYGAFGARTEFGWSYGKLYDKDGYDKDGYDRNGFGKDGYDKYGYDKNGYDHNGFDKTGKHKDTGTKYDKNGFDSRYRHKNGTDYDDDGYNRNGFDRKGKHRNGTMYDDDGYDASAFDKDGYSRDGFDRNRFDRTGKHTGTGTKWDYGGFDKKGKNRDTGTKFDKDGYDQRGFDKNGRNRWGYDKDGYDNKGFNEKGHHKDTGTKYNDRGFDRDGKHENGTRYDDDGYDKWGYDKSGNHMDPNRPPNPHRPPPKKPPTGHVEG